MFNGVHKQHDLNGVRRALRAIRSALIVGMLTHFTAAAQAQVQVLTQHNDNSRTGANLDETILKSSNVSPGGFGKLFTRNVDGEVYAQPLYVPRVTVAGKGVHNVVYVATMNNSVYAFDADHADQSAPLWQVNFGPPVPASDVQCCCTDISTIIGILSTPVIDMGTASTTRNTMFLVARNKNSDGSYHQYLIALDITSGDVKARTEITAAYGSLEFDPKIHNQRPALLLLKGTVYIAWASHNDCGHYHGWIMGYSASTLQQTAVYSDTVSSIRGGIWQGGQGLTADYAGNVYAMSGNGSFNANTGGADLGCSFIKLDGRLHMKDWFTPFNVDDLNAADADLGASGPLGIPGTHYLVGGGKEGKLYLVDTDNMGHFTAGSDNVVQSFAACNGHIHGSPIYYDSPVNGPCVYVWSEQDQLKVFKFLGKSFDTNPIAYSSEFVPNGMPGAMMSVSAKGNNPGTGIIWTSHPLDANANNAVVEGIVSAYDASATTLVNGQPQLKELWNSKMVADRDNIGNFAKFCPPTIANGRVYMATFGPVGTQGTGQLVVYGLLPAVKPPSPIGLRAIAGNAQITLTWAAVSNVSSYDLYRATIAGGEGATPYQTGLTGTSFVDTGLTNGVAYYYRLSAVNGAGEGNKSPEVDAVPSAKLTNTTILAPTDDAYTKSGAFAGQNFGSSPQLIVKISPPDLTRYTFVKFDLSQVSGTVTGARLRLYGGRQGANSSSSDSACAVPDTDWTEGLITWNNMPALGQKLYTQTVTSTQQWYYWDVTAYVTAQLQAGVKVISLAVTMDSLPADGYPDSFNSKEAGVNAPQLALSVKP